MKCYNPIFIKQEDKKKFKEGGLLVPCGKCIACREQKTREYVIRFTKEKSKYKHTGFITLTYDKEHCPKDYSLKKEDVVKYIKRVNKEATKREIKYKYYLTGEYGEEASRPHYHMVVASNDKDIIKICGDKWGMGKVSNEEGSIKSIYYTVGYVDKKIATTPTITYMNEEGKRLKVNQWGTREAPFRKFSKGLGKDWLKENVERVKADLHIKDKGIPYQLPQYFKRKLIEWGELKEEDLQRLGEEQNRKMIKYYNQKYGKKEAKYVDQVSGIVKDKEVDKIIKQVNEQKRREYERKYYDKQNKRKL